VCGTVKHLIDDIKDLLLIVSSMGWGEELVY
jgi:hypothetical protein